MKDLFVLAYFDENGEFVGYIRKGRNGAISGYDNYTSAKRGLAQTKGMSSWVSRNYTPKIVKAAGTIIVEGDAN